MTERSNQAEPSRVSREHILKDLETAGLLRLLDTRPVRRKRIEKREAPEMPAPELHWALDRARKRRFALLAIMLAVILGASLILLLLDGL